MRTALKRTGMVLAGAAVLTLGLDYAAMAATGKSLLLGKTNKAGATTTVQNTKGGPALSLKTKSNATAPLKVNGTGKVINLNSDKLDNLDSTQLQRKVGSCASGTAITAVSPTGAVTCGNLPRAATWTPAATSTLDTTFDLYTAVTYPAGSYVVTGAFSGYSETGSNSLNSGIGCAIFHTSSSHIDEKMVATNFSVGGYAQKYGNVSTVVTLTEPRVLNLYCYLLQSGGGTVMSLNAAQTHLDIVRLDGPTTGGKLDLDD